MSELHSSREIARALERLGYTFHSQRGSHGKYKNSAGRIVILPMNRKEIPEGTFYSILKQAGISLDELKGT